LLSHTHFGLSLVHEARTELPYGVSTTECSNESRSDTRSHSFNILLRERADDVRCDSRDIWQPGIMTELDVAIKQLLLR
jgi:hypothetical protein